MKLLHLIRDRRARAERARELARGLHGEPGTFELKLRVTCVAASALDAERHTRARWELLVRQGDLETVDVETVARIYLEPDELPAQLEAVDTAPPPLPGPEVFGDGS